MRIPLRVALALMLAAISSLCLADGIKWQKDLNAALKTAKKLKKPVMIDFYGDY